MMSDIIAIAQDCVPKKRRAEFYEHMIKLFEDEDCDTLCECLGEDQIYDEVYNRLNPEDE